MNNRNTPVERLTDKELHDRIITIIANDMISNRESEELRELLARWDAAERMLIKFITIRANVEPDATIARIF